jgi:hypothetical protein
MRSRPARLTLCALAWIVLGAAAFFVFQQQQQIDARRAALRAFESTSRDAFDALDGLQAGQQAYVAVGQHPADWTAKVGTYMQTAASSIDTLRAGARSQAAGPSLLDASTAMTQVANIDRRVRQHLDVEETAAAADQIFGEAADANAAALSNVDAALNAERQAADGFESTRRRAQVYAAAAGTGFAAIVLAILGFAPPSSGASDAPTTGEADAADAGSDGSPEPKGMAAGSQIAAGDPRGTRIPNDGAAATGAITEATLQTLAGVCTEFGRVRDAAQLKPLLEQGATLMNARGLIVWLGSTAGSDLRPVLAHGYSDATLAHLSTVPRSADNAAAAAYRSGELQVVKSTAKGSQGAIVAPLLAGTGCIGALTAEIRDRGESSEPTHALARILASQLAGVLATAAEAAVETPAGGTASSQAAAG